MENFKKYFGKNKNPEIVEISGFYAVPGGT